MEASQNEQTPPGYVADPIPDEESSEDSLSPDQSLRRVHFIRKPVPRKTGTRVDIYYFDECNPKQRLRSLHDVKRYCTGNGILFEPELFNFSGSNLEEGVICKNSGDPVASALTNNS